jgi:hypothetical protein
MVIELWQWIRRLWRSLIYPFQLLIDGISGSDRREKRKYKQALTTLEAEHDQLRRELEEVRQRVGLERQELQARCKVLRDERDDLQIEVWELEQLIEELLDLLPDEPDPDHLEPEADITTGEPEADLSPSEGVLPLDSALEAEASQVADLSTLKLALVGGHDTTRRSVIQELTEQYGLINWVELPPFRKHSLGRSRMKAKLHDCDLIVVITGYMAHKQTDSLSSLKNTGNLSGELLMLNCRGKSGVVREILAHVTQAG